MTTDQGPGSIGNAQVGPALTNLALGLTHFGTVPRSSNRYPNPREAIEVFGKIRNAASYYHWQVAGLTPTTDVRFDFAAAFDEATRNGRLLHFHLDGFDLSRAWRLGQVADPFAAGVTNWEFVRVLVNRSLRQKTLFWQNQAQVPLDRVLARAGVSPHAIP